MLSESQQAGRRALAFVVAPIGFNVAFNIALQKHWFDFLPDEVVAVIWLISIMVFLYGVWLSPWVQER